MSQSQSFRLAIITELKTFSGDTNMLRLFIVAMISMTLTNCGTETDKRSAFGENAKKYHDSQVRKSREVVEVLEETQLTDDDSRKVIIVKMKDKLGSKISTDTVCEPVRPESKLENKKWISKPVSEVEDNNNELISETCEKRDFLKNCKKRVYTYKTTCEFKLVTVKNI